MSLKLFVALADLIIYTHQRKAVQQSKSSDSLDVPTYDQIAEKSCNSKVSRKRKMDEIEQDALDINPRKKRKLNFKNPKIKCIFNGEEDKKQFFSIFKCLNKSNLINKLNVPSVITQQIAEMAIGIIKDCDECDGKVIITPNEWKKIEDDKWGLTEFDDFAWDVDDKYWCNKCMEDVPRCDSCDGITYADGDTGCILCLCWEWI